MIPVPFEFAADDLPTPHAEEAAAPADNAMGYGVAAEGRVVAYPGAEVPRSAQAAC